MNGTIENITNATIRLYYEGSNIDGIDEDTLGIYYWNPSTEQWEFVESAKGSDAKGKFISANVGHFSLYALFGDEIIITKSASRYDAPAMKVPEKKQPEAPKVQLEAPKVPSIETPKEAPKTEAPKAEEKKTTPPTGRLIGASGAGILAAVLTLFAGGLYIKKKGII